MHSGQNSNEVCQNSYKYWLMHFEDEDSQT